jgi:RNA polymerase sigma-70 factor (ECF subfamily)
LRIASRAVADHWQRSGRESGNPADTLSQTDRPGPEEIERSAMLFQMVDRLPEAQFRVIHMRFVEQKSIREIAGEMGRSEGAVKQLQLRAIENLRAQMEGAHA